MTDRSTFETRLEARLMTRASIATRPFDAARIAQAAALAGRRPRGGGLRNWSFLGARTPRPVIVLLFVVLLLAIAAAVLVGSSLLRHPQRLPGAIYPAGPFAQRSGDSIAVLDDGRVLFVGGTSGDQQTSASRAELYDPATNAFAVSGPMVQPRSLAAAVTLTDGRVLVAGGVLNPDGFIAMSTAELFDPGTGTFVSTGSMYEARSQPSAVRLADGRVLVFGGTSMTNDRTDGLTSAEIYDPSTGAWSSAGALPSSRSSNGGNGARLATATRLPDGRVLVAGGSVGNRPLASALLFDPTTATFSPTGAMTVARSDASATLLPDGRVLIVGGNAATPASPPQGVALASAELFDPATGRFAATGSLRTERYSHAATLLADGRVLVAGGANGIGQALSTELYDPATGTFSLGALAGSTHSAAALLPSGRVLLAGDQPEVFDPSAAEPKLPSPAASLNRTFLRAADPIQDRVGHTATKLRDGRVLIVGGEAPDGTVLSSAEIYDPQSGTFTSTGSLHTGRLFQTALLLPDGRVLIAGGLPASKTPVLADAIELYDPATGEFTEGGQLGPTHLGTLSAVAAVRVSTGLVLIIAYPPSFGGSLNPAGTEVYALDPGRAVLTLVETLPPCLLADGDAALDDGRVLLWCTNPDTGTPTSLRFFDPASGQLTSPGLEGAQAPVLRLQDGRVLLYDWESTGALEILDPGTQLANTVGHLPTDMGQVTASRLADGRVLLIGYTYSLIWNPETNVFTKTVPMLTGLGSETATLLDDGRVLIVGGTSWPADRDLPHPPAAELFDPAAAP